jgi:hypothetical protein
MREDITLTLGLVLGLNLDLDLEISPLKGTFTLDKASSQYPLG